MATEVMVVASEVVVVVSSEAAAVVARVAKVGTPGPRERKSCQSAESTAAEQKLSRVEPHREPSRVASTRRASRIGVHLLRRQSHGSSSRRCTSLLGSRNTRGPKCRKSC